LAAGKQKVKNTTADNARALVISPAAGGASVACNCNELFSEYF
jgi:hypothetical protein